MAGSQRAGPAEGNDLNGNRQKRSTFRRPMVERTEMSLFAVDHFAGHAAIHNIVLASDEASPRGDQEGN